MICETAPAKINLYLHVGPIRADGLHALASLFVFTEEGDEIHCAPADELSLAITGPYAEALADLPAPSNLVWKAAVALKDACHVKNGAALTLVKNLPLAAGVGGGSADAAAALRALVRLWRIDISAADLEALAFGLGADVPACLTRAPINVAGAGEKLTPGPVLPRLWACLVNPRIDMPTGAVFKDFDAAQPAPAAPALIDMLEATYEAVAAMMAASRNDLESIAAARAPEIGAVLEFLRQSPGVLAARMSGSGATCFGLFAAADAAQMARDAAAKQDWWAMASPLVTG